MPVSSKRMANVAAASQVVLDLHGVVLAAGGMTIEIETPMNGLETTDTYMVTNLPTNRNCVCSPHISD